MKKNNIGSITILSIIVIGVIGCSDNKNQIEEYFEDLKEETITATNDESASSILKTLNSITQNVRKSDIATLRLDISQTWAVKKWIEVNYVDANLSEQINIRIAVGMYKSEYPLSTFGYKLDKEIKNGIYRENN